MNKSYIYIYTIHIYIYIYQKTTFSRFSDSDPPGCLWVSPGCLLGASWEFPGCLLGVPWASLSERRKKKLVWGLVLGSFLWIRSGFQVVISPVSQFAAWTQIFTWGIFIGREYIIETPYRLPIGPKGTAPAAADSSRWWCSCLRMLQHQQGANIYFSCVCLVFLKNQRMCGMW